MSLFLISSALRSCENVSNTESSLRKTFFEKIKNTIYSFKCTAFGVTYVHTPFLITEYSALSNEASQELILASFSSTDLLDKDFFIYLLVYSDHYEPKPELKRQELIPIFVFAAIPVEAVKQNPHLALLITCHGGHIGFLEGLWPRQSTYMDRVFKQYAKAVIEQGGGLNDLS